METMNKGPPKNATEDELTQYLKQLCSDVTLQSRKDGFFSTWLEQVKSNLSGNFVHHFGKLKTDEDRIVYLWSVKPLHTLKVQKFFKPKNAELSEQKRNDGNKAFQKKQHQEAVSLYSQAVTKAPSNGKMLSYAYANRSAVLFHIKKYSYCLQDIELALQHGYPLELHYKILERRGCCLERQGNFSEALEEFQLSLKCLKEAKLEEDKNQSWIENINTKIEGCKDKENKNIRVEMDDRQPLVGGPAPCLQLFQGISSALPNASSAVGIKSSPEQGRYAVALQDIPAGQLIVSEEPFASVLVPEKSGGHCTHCCFKLTAPVCCPDCSGVAFCSPGCRDSAVNSYHQWECSFGDLLFASGMSLNGYLALRIITEKTVKYFKELKPELEEINTPSATNPHRPSEYISVYQQVGLESDRDAFDFLQRTLMAVFLLKVLQRSGYFGTWNDDDSPDADLKQDELMIGSFLLRNLQVIQFNAHELSGMSYYGSLKNFPFKSSRSIYLGLAVYPTVAFFNHSCIPSVTRYFNGREMKIVTMRPLKKGEMIAENYGPIFTHHPREDRLKKLKSRYWFDCTCPPCTERWPTYTEMKSMSFRCLDCGHALPPPNDDDGKIDTSLKATCEKCKKIGNISSAMLQMIDAQECYKEGRKLLDQGQREVSINHLLRFIEVSSLLVTLPHKELHQALEALRLLIAARGTSYFIEPKK